MTPLALAGVADKAWGFPDGHRTVVRFRDPTADAEITVTDAAIIHAVDDLVPAIGKGFTRAVAIGSDLTPSDLSTFSEVAFLSPRFSYLSDGDIVGFDPKSRRFRTLYRKRSPHNAFLITERCNHYCLMCSQPPRDIDDGWIIDEIAACVPLIDPATPSIGFTGGEPLLEWKRFIRLLAIFAEALPATALHVLTNGRAFAEPQVTIEWVAIKHQNLCAAIPVYSCVDSVHDYVVQSRGAFDETLHGILRLKDKGQRVEIRLVLHAVTANGLAQTCEWLARNLPFVDHVALMALENTGFALANQDVLWIDPVDYQDQLSRGVGALANAGMNVSIYNLPRCVLPAHLWPYAAQSISDWKNGFVDECSACSERPRCSGFFTSGRPRLSRGVRAIHASSSSN